VHSFILVSILALTLSASHVSWYGNFNEAHKQSIKDNKKLMVLLIKKNCSVCKEVVKTTFSNQEYIDSLNKDFISVIITKNQAESYPIEMLYTLTYPTLFFLDKNELFVCKPLRGEVTPERLKNHLKLCK